MYVLNIIYKKHFVQLICIIIVSNVGNYGKLRIKYGPQFQYFYS